MTIAEDSILMANLVAFHARLLEALLSRSTMNQDAVGQTHRSSVAPTSAVRQASRASSSPPVLESGWRIGGELHRNAVMEKKTMEKQTSCDVRRRPSDIGMRVCHGVEGDET